MYTVLLVDDEEDVLKNLLKLIDWPVYGVENILTAANGLDAWDILTTHHVDLLITDIRMPRLDGIELIRRLQQVNDRTRCILLTSYSDFEYAKEAIALGVENYLLKPYKVDELESSIRKALDNISMHKHITDTLFMDNILYRWVMDDISSEDLTERSKHIGVNIYFRNYCVILVKSLQKKSMSSLLSPFFSAVSPQCDLYHFKDYDGNHVIILGGHKITQSFISDTLNTIMKDHSVESSFLITIGNVATGYENVPKSYKSALECMLMAQNTSSQRILLASKKESFNLNDIQINQIITYLRDPNFLENEDNLSALFDSLFPDLSAHTLQEVNSFIEKIPIRLALQLNSLGLIDSSVKDSIINNAYHFDELPTKEAVFNWFSGILSICQMHIKKHAKSLSPIILSTIQYITDNYTGYISIKDFCNTYHMNASYLGLLFKKETGIYFNDYINQVRVNAAIQLIKTSNMKISELCKKVGFLNTSYFILCFKKQTGVSPAKFRQMHEEKHDWSKVTDSMPTKTSDIQ